ncbi:hypothetical protein ACFX1X_046282 [Malus domestica]
MHQNPESFFCICPISNTVSLCQLDQKGTGPGARSSHAITLVGQKAYVFEGEFTPRVPVDNKLHVFDVKEQTWYVIEGTRDVPPPCVGVTLVAVGEIIYVFGGRDYEHNELYSFDTSTHKWTLISSGDTGAPHRSYHSVTSDDHHVYIFGGCGVAGRSMIYGPTMSLIKSGSNTQIREVDDVHILDPAHGEWAQVGTNGKKPTARRVFSTVAISKYIIIYGGEVDPSDLGHLGAGKFAAEVYALDTETLLWKKWDDGLGSGHPGPRGWCAPAGSGRGKRAFWCMVGIHQLMIDLVIFISSLLTWKKVSDWIRHVMYESNGDSVMCWKYGIMGCIYVSL